MADAVVAAATQRWTDADEKILRYVDTYHDFVGPRGFSNSATYDKFGRTEMFKVMNQVVRGHKNDAGDVYYIGDAAPEGDPLKQVLRSKVESSTVELFENRYPALFRNLTGLPIQKQNTYIVRISDLAKAEFYKKMRDGAYIIEEDIEVNERNRDSITNNLKLWLGYGESQAVMCDGPPTGLSKALIDGGKFKYAYTWPSAYDSAGIIGEEKKRKGTELHSIVSSGGQLNVTSIFQLSVSSGADLQVRDKLLAGTGIGNFEIAFTGSGKLGGKSYIATQNRGFSVNELTLMIKLTEGISSASVFKKSQKDKLFESYMKAAVGSVRVAFDGNKQAIKEFFDYERAQLYAMCENPMIALFEGADADSVRRIALDIKATGDSSQVIFYEANRPQIAFAYTNDILCSLHFRSRNLSVAISSTSTQSRRTTKFYRGELVLSDFSRRVKTLSQLLAIINPIISFAAHLHSKMDVIHAIIAQTKIAFAGSKLVQSNKYLKYLIQEKIIDTERFITQLKAALDTVTRDIDVKRILTATLSVHKELNDTPAINTRLEQCSEIIRTYYDLYYTRFDALAQNCGFSRYLDGNFEFTDVVFIESDKLNENSFFRYDMDLIETVAIIEKIVDQEKGRVMHFNRRQFPSIVEEKDRKLAAYADSFYAPEFRFILDTGAEQLGRAPVAMAGGGIDDEFGPAAQNVLLKGTELYNGLYNDFKDVVEFKIYDANPRSLHTVKPESLRESLRPSVASTASIHTASPPGSVATVAAPTAKRRRTMKKSGSHRSSNKRAELPKALAKVRTYASGFGRKTLKHNIRRTGARFSKTAKKGITGKHKPTGTYTIGY